MKIIMLPVKVEERRKEEGSVVEDEWYGCAMWMWMCGEKKNADNLGRCRPKPYLVCEFLFFSGEYKFEGRI